MKIAILIDTWFPYFGGGQISVYEIHRRLASKVYQVDIITRNLGPSKLNLPRGLREVKLGKRCSTPKNFSENSMSNILSRFKFLLEAYLYLSNHHYDLIIIHPFYPVIPAKLISFLKKIPTVMTIHGTILPSNIKGHTFKKIIEKFILTRFNYTFQISASRDFLKVSNVNRKVFYVPNGIDVKQFDKIKISHSNKILITFVGRIHWQKNIEALINAMPHLLKKYPQVKLQIVGDGPLLPILEQQVARNKLNENITFLGKITGQKLMNIYKSSTLFVLPSIYEGQPLALFEAWAAKLPVVVSKTGDTPILVKDGYNGYLIPDQLNHLSIAATILKALKNPRLRLLGQNGYNFVNKNFSWDKSAAKTLKIYKKVLTQ